MRMEESSDRSLLLVMGEAISLEAHHRVLRLTQRLGSVRGVVNLHPAYTSILIDFDPLRVTHADVRRWVEQLDAEAASEPLPEGRMLEIPVRYGGEDGPDLEAVAAAHGLAVDEVIALHSGADYLVYFLGFSPGFPYLGGMPEALATARLATPRRRVPAGSVAIGGWQTGIYPSASPGGWRVIGRTPMQLFQPDADPPVRLRMGDQVKFVPVNKDGV